MNQAASSTPITSLNYLQQMRQRRLERNKSINPVAQVTRSAPQPSQPTPTKHPAQPQAPKAATSTPVSTKKSAEKHKKSHSKKEKRRNKDLFPGITKPQPEDTILEWQAPSRPFKKRDGQYYRTVGAIVLLISLILFFAGQFLPIAVVISVGFLTYVLSSVPPENILNKITTYGIRIEENLYYWEELGRYWFENKFKQRILKIEAARFPGRVTLLIQKDDEKKISEVLSEVLLLEKPDLTFFDKSAKWLQKKIPLEASG